MSQTITAVFESVADAEGAARDLAVQVGGVRAAVFASEADAANLHELGISAPDRQVLTEAIRRGGAVLSASVPDDQTAEVSRVLEGSKAVDLDAREAEWRQSGWSDETETAPAGGATATTPMTGRPDNLRGAAASNTIATGTGGPGTTGTTATGIGSAAPAGTATAGTTGTRAGLAATGQEEMIPVVEERLRVGKRQAAMGRIRIHSHVVETPVQEQVSLHQEHVQVERRPVNQPIDAASGAVFQDRTIEATETTEEAVVAKEARVVEEVVLRKTADDETRTISDSVRRTEVEVEDDRVAGRTATTTPVTPSRDR